MLAIATYGLKFVLHILFSFNFSNSPEDGMKLLSETPQISRNFSNILHVYRENHGGGLLCS